MSRKKIELMESIRNQIDEKGFVIFAVDCRKDCPDKFFKKMDRMKDVWYHVIKRVYMEDELLLEIVIAGFEKTELEFYDADSIKDLMEKSVGGGGCDRKDVGY